MEVLIILIVLLIIIAAISGMISGIVKVSKKNIDLQSTRANYNAEIAANFKHISGLPIPPGLNVSVFCTKEKLLIVNDAQEIALDSSKLIAINAFSGKDIQTQASGALAGGLLFGLTGAVIGALVSSSTYMVITYETNGETKYLTLDSESNPANVKKIADYYASQLSGKVSHIDL